MLLTIFSDNAFPKINIHNSLIEKNIFQSSDDEEAWLYCVHTCERHMKPNTFTNIIASLGTYK